MERKRITCPETAHLEEVDLERTSLGIVIGGCSRFEPRCAVGCSGECARRMDLRDHQEIEDLQERVLVAYASHDGPTRAVVDGIAAALRRDALTVEVADVATRAPPPADYDVVVLGSRVRFGLPAAAAVDYVARHRDALAAMPAFWFTVGKPSIDRITSRTGWVPRLHVRFARDEATDRARIDAFARAIADEVPAVAE